MVDRWSLFVLLPLLALFAAGCGGAGSTSEGVSSVLRDSPEAALARTIRTWQQEGGGPTLNLISHVPQSVVGAGTTASGTLPPASEASSSTSLGTVTFQDLSGKTWEFSIQSVTYVSVDQARILTLFYGGSDHAQIELVFSMVRTQDGWLIDDITFTKLPEVIVVDIGVLRGVVTESQTGKPIVGALVTLAGTTYSTATDLNGAYEFKELPPGTYTLVVNHDGYIIKTITGIVVQ